MIFLKNFFEKRIITEEDERPPEERRQLAHRESSSLTLRTPEEEVLETREKSSSRPLEGGANTKSFIELKDDGAGVFKPKSGERKGLRQGLEQGTYYKRERAAYLVDRFLGFDLVPPTVIRMIDGEEGSVQQFIPDALSIYDRSLRNRDGLKPDLMKLWIFDYIIWNSDRSSKNFLVKDDKIYAIDHGCTFCYGEDSLRFYSHSSYENEQIPKDITDKINQFLSWGEGIKILGELLKELLPEAEAKACVARIKKIGEILARGQINAHDASQLFFDPKIPSDSIR